MEYRRFPRGQSPVSTFSYHEHRERAPHLEQPTHRGRLELAVDTVCLVIDYLEHLDRPSLRVVDLGCGDGGLLQLLQSSRCGAGVIARGYDFQPSNAAGWGERGVRAESLNFIDNWSEVLHADVYVCTEVLEHLEDPHHLLRRVRARNAALVCSSPHDEHEGSIDASHNWAWDFPGYRALVDDADFDTVHHMTVDRFQVIGAVPHVG